MIILLYNCEIENLEDWEKTLLRYKQNYISVSTESNWEYGLKKENPDLIIARPHGSLESKVKKFKEVVYKVSERFNIPVYPDLKSLAVYENKIELATQLKSHNIPHPQTFWYNDFSNAESAISNLSFPLVAKSNSGAAGSGVILLKNLTEGKNLLRRVFKEDGFPKRVGPNIKQGGLLKRFFNVATKPGKAIEKLNYYTRSFKEKQKGLILFQEFISHEFEWRVVRIGNSFFAHKKMLKNGMASGSKEKGYDNPPLSVLNFVREVSDVLNIKSAAYDLFEIENEKFLVNEIQTYFGQSDPYQMLIDGKPARYYLNGNNWEVHFGDYASNKCYDLRFNDALSLIASK